LQEPCGRLKFILVISIPVFFCGVAAWTTIGIIPFKFWIVIHSLLITLSSFMQPVVVTIVQDVTPVPVCATAIATTLFFAQILVGVIGPLAVGGISDALGGGTWGLKGGGVTYLNSNFGPSHNNAALKYEILSLRQREGK
jgi:hypothetical protein